MSKICMILVSNLNNLYHARTPENDLKEIVRKYEMGIFTEKKYDEPFLDHYDSYCIFSLADNYKYDNCEMFLLPDGWYSNGRTNEIPFIKRMEIIRDCVKRLSESNRKIEIFLGDSGAQYDDFTHLTVFQDEVPYLPNLIENHFYGKNGRDYELLHITIYGENT